VIRCFFYLGLVKPETRKTIFSFFIFRSKILIFFYNFGFGFSLDKSIKFQINEKHGKKFPVPVKIFPFVAVSFKIIKCLRKYRIFKVLKGLLDSTSRKKLVTRIQMLRNHKLHKLLKVGLFLELIQFTFFILSNY